MSHDVVLAQGGPTQPFPSSSSAASRRARIAKPRPAAPQVVPDRLPDPAGLERQALPAGVAGAGGWSRDISQWRVISRAIQYWGEPMS
ncbi:MAG: hypothetical protein AB1Z22_08590, partial [Synechococcaceae cyanobacterium]